MNNIPPNLKEDNSTRASLELLYNISRELAQPSIYASCWNECCFYPCKMLGLLMDPLIVLDDNGIPVNSAIITGDTVHKHTTKRLADTLDKGLSGWVVHERKVALVENTHRDPRWMPRRYEDDKTQVPKSAVCAPILTRNKLVGVLTLVHPRPGFFRTEHVALVQAIADQAGIAVLNARLYDESQRQAGVMTALAKTALGDFIRPQSRGCFYGHPGTNEFGAQCPGGHAYFGRSPKWQPGAEGCQGVVENQNRKITAGDRTWNILLGSRTGYWCDHPRCEQGRTFRSQRRSS